MASIKTKTSLQLARVHVIETGKSKVRHVKKNHSPLDSIKGD